MARIKIEELPVLEDLSKKELKGIFGGALRTQYSSDADSEINVWEPPNVGPRNDAAGSLKFYVDDSGVIRGESPYSLDENGKKVYDNPRFN